MQNNRKLITLLNNIDFNINFEMLHVEKIEFKTMEIVKQVVGEF